MRSVDDPERLPRAQRRGCNAREHFATIPDSSNPTAYLSRRPDLDGVCPRSSSQPAPKLRGSKARGFAAHGGTGSVEALVAAVM